MRKWTVLVIVIYPSFAAAATANEETDLKRRVQQLEQQTQTLQKSHDALLESSTKTLKEGELAQDTALELEKQLHSKLQTSGYADVEFGNDSGEGKHPSFRIHHFSLIFTKKIDEHWRSFAEIEYEDAPRIEFTPGSSACQGDCSGQIFLEAMNVDYSPSDLAGVRFGRFFTPAGIWSIDHYPPFVVTQERPLHIHNIFPQLIDGAMVHGTFPLRDTFLNYDVYAGNGEGSSAHGDNNHKKSLGLRAAIQLPWLTQFELGTSAYTDTLTGGNQAETSKFATGFHAKAQMGQVAFQSEIASARYQPKTGANYTQAGYYAQLGVDISAATIGYRYDFFEDYDLATAKKADLKRNSLFANYRVHKNVVLKLEHHRTTRDQAGRENLTLASIAVYLGE